MKAVNPITGKVAFQKVTERHARTTQAGLVKVTLKDEAGRRETLSVTFNHPYLRAANDNDPGLNLVKMEPGGQWSAAGLLKLGDKVQSGAVGELEVVKVEQLDNTSARVYNLEVAGYHSYAVGTLEAWVHNATPNQLNQQIRRGQAPAGAIRVDIPRTPGEQVHIHLELDGVPCALNKDGSWKHRPKRGGTISRRLRNWLVRNDWVLPD